MVIRLGPHGVADHHHPLGADPRPPDLRRLPFRDTDHAIHAAQNSALQRLVESYMPGGRRPAVRDGHHRDAGPACRPPAQQVGLVAVAAEHAGPQPPQVILQLVDHGAEVGHVLLERDPFEAVLPHLIEQATALAILGEDQEGGLVRARQTLSQPEHLPLGSAEKRGRC